MDILKLSLAQWNDGTFKRARPSLAATTDMLGIALPTDVGFAIAAGAGIHFPVLHRIHGCARSLARLPSFDVVLSQNRFS
jgi:hypothetical protein